MSKGEGLLLGIGIIAVIISVILAYGDNHVQEYNDHVCRVYGYQSDCHTPLDPEDKLK